MCIFSVPESTREKERNTCPFESSLIWIKHMPSSFGAEPCQPQEGSKKGSPLSTKMFNPAIMSLLTESSAFQNP